MNDPRPWAVVPVKTLDCAKQRLAPLLSSGERALLAGTMLQDVLTVLVGHPSLGGTLVVTNDGRAAELASAAGAFVLPDAPDRGLNAAVSHAAQELAVEGCPGIILVPADLPSIKPADIEALASVPRVLPAVTIVEATADGGTNALACWPPQAIRFRYGGNSFRLHLASASARGVQATVLDLARLARDIDRPEDVLALAGEPSASRSRAFLLSSGIASRLGQPEAAAI